MEHVPGPWTWDYCPKVYAVDEDGVPFVIADVDPHNDLMLKTAIGTACLMAAATDLLAACEASDTLMAALALDDIKHILPEAVKPLWVAVHLKVQAAIAKAKEASCQRSPE